MMQDIFEVGSRTIVYSAFPNLPQLIKEDFLGVLLPVFITFFFFLLPLLEIFLPTPLIITSAVARVPCALGQEIFLRPPPPPPPLKT